MSTIILSALLTAILSVGLFWLTALLLFNKVLQPLWQKKWQEKLQEELQEKVDQLIESKLEQIGDLVEERVRAGVVQGANEVTSPENMRRTMAKGQSNFFHAMNTMFGHQDGNS